MQWMDVWWLRGRGCQGRWMCAPWRRGWPARAVGPARVVLECLRAGGRLPGCLRMTPDFPRFDPRSAPCRGVWSRNSPSRRRRDRRRRSLGVLDAALALHAVDGGRGEAVAREDARRGRSVGRRARAGGGRGEAPRAVEAAGGRVPRLPRRAHVRRLGRDDPAAVRGARVREALLLQLRVGRAVLVPPRLLQPAALPRRVPAARRAGGAAAAAARRRRRSRTRTRTTCCRRRSR